VTSDLGEDVARVAGQVLQQLHQGGEAPEQQAVGDVQGTQLQQEDHLTDGDTDRQTDRRTEPCYYERQYREVNG